MANDNASKAMQAFEKVADNSSSNINEVIRAVLNSLLFFLRKDLSHTKSTKSIKSTKGTKAQPCKSTKTQISEQKCA